jgi:hypothetical protein
VLGNSGQPVSVGDPQPWVVMAAVNAPTKSQARGKTIRISPESAIMPAS